VVVNVSISGGTHNVEYVTTENNGLYAIDADNGSILWQTSLGTPVPSGDAGCGDLVPQIGITSTPVIDTTSGTIYLVAKTKETISGSTSYVQKLHAIDMATHAEKLNGPMTISATVPSTTGGTISFDTLNANQRAGLLLQNGHIIIGWGSHCDNLPFHGWIVSYNAATLEQEAVLCPVPTGTTSVYGDYNGTTDYGDTILKLSGPNNNNSFSIADWFTPWDQATLNSNDGDLGSGGVLLLPDLPSGSAHQQLLVQVGKGGTIYLIDRNNMGKFCSSSSSSNTQIVQEIPGGTRGMWGMPAYWNGNLYFGAADDGGSGDTLKAFSFNTTNGLLSTSPTSHTLRCSTSVDRPHQYRPMGTRPVLRGRWRTAATDRVAVRCYTHMTQRTSRLNCITRIKLLTAAILLAGR
jgi:PQQ enzyme-like repeat protein